MTRWIALAPHSTGVVGFSLKGDSLEARAADETEASVLKQLGAADVLVRLGDGKPDRLPTALLPDGGTSLPALEQTSPPDILSAWVRLWIAGALAERPHWDGVVCATHGDITHWVHVSANEAISAQSVLTPRLVTALGGAATAEPDALADTLSRPERLAAHLRQAEVSGQRAAITGHLLGAELAATRPYWLGQEVLVVSRTPDWHVTALLSQGVPATPLDPEDLILPGLSALGAALQLAE